MSHYENESGGGGNSLGWFLAGLGFGALIGVLYAPKAGAETRAELAASARDGQEYLRRRGVDLRNQAGDLVEQGKEQFDEYYAKGRQQFDEYVNAGKELYSKGLGQWGEVVERGKSVASDQAGRVQAAVEAGKEAYRSTSAGGTGTGTTGSGTGTNG